MGLLTGVSYISGLDYYRTINEEVASLMHESTNLHMPKNSRMVVASVDCDTYVDVCMFKEFIPSHPTLILPTRTVPLPRQHGRM